MDEVLVVVGVVRLPVAPEAGLRQKVAGAGAADELVGALGDLISHADPVEQVLAVGAQCRHKPSAVVGDCSELRSRAKGRQRCERRSHTISEGAAH